MRKLTRPFRLGLIPWAFSTLAHAAVCPSPALIPLQVKRVIQRSHPAFTEGLLFWQGKLYESIGLYGQSGIQRVDPLSGESENLVSLPSDQFGEGLALSNGEMLQLTWKQGVLWRWPLLMNGIGAAASNAPYDREGWGIASGRLGKKLSLVASDGSEHLYMLNPRTFKTSRTLTVQDAHGPVKGLNELEVAEGQIWANVWPSFRLVRIEPIRGCVTGEIDLTPLLNQLDADSRAKAKADPDATPNGIAYDPDSRSLYLTAKKWPLFFQIAVPASRAR